MNKKFLVSVVVMFVTSMLLGFLVHGLMLAPEYAALTNMFRGEADQQQYFVFMLLGHVSLAIGLVWIYMQGKSSAGFMGQGVRFGLGVALLAAIPMYLIYYAVQPMPGMLVVKQILLDSVSFVILGVILAWLNRP